MLISFSGNNGSGKTLLSMYLYNALKTHGDEVIYIKEFQYFILGRLKRMMNKKTQKFQREVIKKRKKNLIAYLLPYVVWFDYLVYMNALKIMNIKKVIIIDRYTLDYLNTWIELGVSNKLIIYLYTTLPKSDLLYYIDVSPKEAFSRFLKREKKRGNIKMSPNHNLHLEFYKRNRKIYKALLVGKKYELINGDHKLNTCKTQVLATYCKRNSIKISEFVI